MSELLRVENLKVYFPVSGSAFEKKVLGFQFFYFALSIIA